MEDHQPQPIHATNSRHTRVMGRLRDSLLFELAAMNPSISVNADHGSLIQRRLQELFNSFHTPTHPPYALMIHRAVMELNNANGSTEEAISEFIKREYKDLPWAHVAILGHHLRKLCDVGELVCTESGRYRVDNGNLGARGEINKALERIEGVERENGFHGQENEKQTQESVLQIVETNYPSRMQERQGGWIQEEVEAHEHSIEGSEERDKSRKGFLGIIEHQSLPQWQDIAVIEGQTDMEGYHRGLAQAENFQKQDEHTTVGDPEQQLPKHQRQGRPPKLKPIADKSTSQKQKLLQPRDQVRGRVRPAKVHRWRQQQLQLYSRGQGQGRRHKLHTDAHQFEEQLQPEDQAQGPVNSLNLYVHRCEEQLQPEDQTQCPINSRNLNAHQREEQLQPEDQDHGPVLFLNLEPEETIYSSQPIELNLPANLALISKQQLDVPISEGSPECTTTLGNELSPTLLYGTSGTYLGVKSQVSASSSLLNVYKHDQPQHWNQGSPKRKLYENTTLMYLEQYPQKHRRRGRPPKAKPDAGYQVELLHLVDGILSEQNPNVLSTSQTKQPSEIQSRVRGPGRPRKVRTDACRCKEQLQPQDQAQGLVSFPNSKPDEIQGQEQKQLKLKSQAQSWERPPNLNSGVDESYSLLPQGSSQDQGWLSEENTPAEQSRWQQLHTFGGVLNSGQSHGRGRGRIVLGRPPKLFLDANESKQLQLSQPCLSQGRRRGRPPKQKPLSQGAHPMLDACQSRQQLQFQQCLSQGRRPGRPPKQKPQSQDSHPMLDACQSWQQLQSQQCLGQGRRRGRPPKQKPQSHDSYPMLDARQSCEQLQSESMSDAYQSYQQLQPQPCQVQDQILKWTAEPQPEVDKS